MENDERFKHLAADPRFKTLRKKQRKVQIDERFQSMFTDEKFTIKYSKDKRGRNQKKTSGDDLKRYYSLEEKVEKPIRITKKEKEKVDNDEHEEGEDVKKIETHNEEEEEEKEEEDKDGEEEEQFVGVQDDADETPESELSSSSDESESELEEEDEANFDKSEYDWQPLDHDAKTADISAKRLAIQNLDWDRLDVQDLYTLVNSVRPPTVVRIYVSEFGKERLKEEELHGPKEIVEMPNPDEVEEEEYKLLESKMKALENPKHKAHEYEDADDELDPKNEEIRERIRRYQLSRMKYYYAVVEFDSIESAELVYKELDGMEYEGSSLELDLRFIPDDIEFDEADMKAECKKIPDLSTYKAPQFISTALQQTSVKITWDETDIKRQEKLHKAYTKEELDRDDLEAYLASDSTEDEDEVEGDANKYKSLLKSLEEEEEKKFDVDVEWDLPDENDQELGKKSKNLDKSKSIDKSKNLDKSKKRGKRKGKEEKEDIELGLRDEFIFNPGDDRFKAVYESGLYNIDPSHPNFKRTQAFDLMAERKREKRRKTDSVVS